MKILFALLLLSPALAMAKGHRNPPNNTNPPDYGYSDEFTSPPDLCPNRCMEYLGPNDRLKGYFTCAARDKPNDGWYGHETRTLDEAKQSALDYCWGITGNKCKLVECHKI